MEKAYKWAWLGLAVYAVIHFTLLFRYEPVPNGSNGGSAIMWDRLTRRSCVAVVGPNQRLLCSPEDYNPAPWLNDPRVN